MPKVTRAEHDLIITAIEGGINYWADVLDMDEDSASMGMLHQEDVDLKTDGDTAPRFVIDKAFIQKGLVAVAEQTKNPAESMVGKTSLLAKVLVANNYENFHEWEMFQDADVADIVVQFALFGELVYG